MTENSEKWEHKKEKLEQILNTKGKSREKREGNTR